jgi:hypothetical protein
MAKTSFFNKFMAVALFVLAAVINFSCDKGDIADETGRKTTSYDASYKETSTLTPDNNQGTAHLAVTVEKSYGTTSEGKRNADVVSKCVANVETDPVETANMEKTFVSGEIVKSTIENSASKQFTCDIKVNGTENLIKTKVTVTPDMAWDRNYDCKVTKVEVASKEVKITETSKKSGEKGRQAISAPVDFTIEAVGTEEPHTCVVRQTVAWEQFQKETTPEIDHEEIASATHTVTNGKDDYVVKVKQVWTDGSETFVEYPYSTTHYFNTISLEDMIVKSWAYSLSKVEGLSVGSESKVKEDGFFTEYSREDLYSALHANGQDANIKTVYMAGIPKVVFTKGELSYTFDFISPSFTENSDDLLDGTSTKSGYDLRVFRNAITAKYGNQNTGIDEQTLEERCNLYKAAKAVADVEFSGMKKTYGLWTITYDVDCIDVYNDGTKSEKYHLTTSRPWSLDYKGAWSMSTENEVKEVIDAIKLSKTGSKTEDQNISNGKWSCTTTSYDVVNYTTVDAKNQKNAWTASVPTHMILTLHGKTCDFGEDTPAGVAKNDKIELTSSTATSEVYTFSEDLNFTVGDYTTTSQATGTVTKAVEVTVTSWEWNADRWVEGKTVKAFVERIYHMSDGSTKIVRREFTGAINSNCYTYFETTEVNNSESTGAAEFVLVNTESKTEGDWKFDYKHSQLNFGITYAGSTQKDGWNIYTYDNLSCTIDGETYTFTGALDMSATANSTQTKKSEDDSKTTYEHSNAATFYFGGSAIALDAAKGLVFVNKTVTPEHHDGFFPKEYGKIEGYNRVACRNPHNQKDWGIGISVKFTNGSICGFITKDGNLEWGSFESGSTTWDGASPDGDGNLMNVTAKDASTAMKWMRGTTVNMLSYSDGTLMGFNWGNNTVYTDHFGGNIEQKDSGKYQVLTISGVQGSWDSSY